MRMRGAGPCSSSQVAGRAMNSPSASRPVISSTVTGGQRAGPRQLAARAGDQPVIGHVAQQLFQGDAVAALDAEGARDLALAGLRRSTVSQKVENFLLGGKLARRRCLAGGCLLLFGQPSWFCHGRRLACRLLGGLLVFRALARGFLRRLLAAAFFAASWRRFLRGFLGRLLLRPDPWRRARRSARPPPPCVTCSGSRSFGMRGVDLAVLHVRTVAAAQHLDLAAALGVLAEVLDDGGAARAAVRGLLGQQADGAVGARPRRPPRACSGSHISRHGGHRVRSGR